MQDGLQADHCKLLRVRLAVHGLLPDHLLEIMPAHTAAVSSSSTIPSVQSVVLFLHPYETIHMCSCAA